MWPTLAWLVVAATDWTAPISVKPCANDSKELCVFALGFAEDHEKKAEIGYLRSTADNRARAALCVTLSEWRLTSDDETVAVASCTLNDVAIVDHKMAGWRIWAAARAPVPKSRQERFAALAVPVTAREEALWYEPREGMARVIAATATADGEGQLAMMAAMRRAAAKICDEVLRETRSKRANASRTCRLDTLAFVNKRVVDGETHVTAVYAPPIPIDWNSPKTQQDLIARLGSEDDTVQRAALRQSPHLIADDAAVTALAPTLEGSIDAKARRCHPFAALGDAAAAHLVARLPQTNDDAERLLWLTCLVVGPIALEPAEAERVAHLLLDGLDGTLPTQDYAKHFALMTRADSAWTATLLGYLAARPHLGASAREAALASAQPAPHQ